MHPALHSWREELPAAFVRLLAYMGGIAVLSIAAAHVFQSPPVIEPIVPVHRSEWLEIERPFPVFALSIPEAADAPESYAIRRHALGGRKDILTLGDAAGVAPFLQVEIYRPGSEARDAADARQIIAEDVAAFGPVLMRDEGPLASKFGALSVVTFDTSKGPARHCLGFVRAYDDPSLLISGWFCQGSTVIEHSTLACALDRLTLLAAGSEPKVGALFAQAELNRSFCGQRSPLMAPTPKHRALWSKTATR